MRGLLLLILAIAPISAQFTSLHTDYRGDQLFFVSTLNYKQQAPTQGGKVYVADSSGIRLLFALQREWVTYPSVPPTYGTTNYYDTVSIDRASNGAAFALTTLRECQIPGSGCLDDQRFTTIYNDQGQPIAGEVGPGRVSRNGEWATAGYYRINLKTGQRRYIGYWQAIADNGTVLMFADPYITTLAVPVEFLRTDGYRYQFSELGTDGTINADGTVGAWVSNGKVRRADLKPYIPKVITAGEGASPQLSDDGSKLLFLSNRQVHIHTDGSARPVTAEQSGVNEAAISGDGQVIWYVTGRGELKRRDLITSETKTVTGPVAAFLDRQLITSAGSATLIRASLSKGQQVKATLRGESVPVIKVNDSQLYVQVPWETPISGYYTMTLEAAGDPDWTGASISIGVVSAAPRFFPDPTEKYATAAHQDFHGLITTEDPAAPGEIVHLYAAGLGRVNPQVPTGVPSPSSPPAEIPRNFPNCYSNAATYTPMDIVWVGLAPGMIGTYQLDFRVPTDAKGTSLDIWCRGDDLGARLPLPLAH